MSADGSTNQGNVVETIQSLIVAFVLAMTFRGFVTEGFVIPTGSMAPTLLGQHALIHSEQTGSTFAVGLDQARPDGRFNATRISDPMLGENYPGSGIPKIKRASGMGDRILVIKTLYPFVEPSRFDVVVFKNPTDPIGDSANYIKRLIGLPNEQVWITDGDVFASKVQSVDLDFGFFKVQRKPEHVQRAVWQPVFDSDFTPVSPRRISMDRTYHGPPWTGDDAVWQMDGRVYRSNTIEGTMLVWESDRRRINDWGFYNMLSHTPVPQDVSDVCVSASVVPAQPGLQMTLQIEARSHQFEFIIRQSDTGRSSTATLRKKPIISPHSTTDWFKQDATIDLPAPGEVFNVEFWHVDQALHLFINGKRAMLPLFYEWSPLERLQFRCGDVVTEDVDMLINRPPLPTQIRWSFEGSPVTLHQVNVRRDLHYRHDTLDPNKQANEPRLYGHAFGTHPFSNAAVLGPDHFMMCGDNSQLSFDSRLWGSPHPLVVEQIGEASPFVVHRKLLIGKAWVVYFPSPFPIKEGGANLVPDFGRLRFIR